MFESSVNSEGIETNFDDNTPTDSFESSVNSEGIETHGSYSGGLLRLRAV